MHSQRDDVRVRVHVGGFVQEFEQGNAGVAGEERAETLEIIV